MDKDAPAGEKYRGSPPWVIVAGGFHQDGGMDKANAALAWHLASNGADVELVSHRVEESLLEHPHVTSHIVPLPRGSILWGERLLERQGKRVAREALVRNTRARVVVNGGNCSWPGINWVHYVHHAWRPELRGTHPESVKNVLSGRLFRRNERRALRKAELLLANSNRTRDDVIRLLGVEPEKVETIYLGNDPSWGEPEGGERASARRRFAIEGDRPLVVFVGAIGSDDRKGFDTLWEAWRQLDRSGSWKAQLLVAGGGRTIEKWRRKTSEAGMSGGIRFLGFITNVDELLAAADLLVSPVRYESYGLNVQEAMCRGLPAIVSASAGVAEKYPASMLPLLLTDPDDAAELAQKLRAWADDMQSWRSRFSSLGRQLRSYSWDQMAAEIVRVVDQRFR